MLTLLDIISFCLGFGKDEKAVDVPGLLNKTVADACAGNAHKPESSQRNGLCLVSQPMIQCPRRFVARGKDWGPTCLVYVNTSLQDCWESVRSGLLPWLANDSMARHGLILSCCCSHTVP